MKRFSLLFVIMLFCLAVLGSAQAATVINEFGRSPFHKPPLTSVEELRAMVDGKQAEVRKGFSLAGRDELAEPFITQIRTVSIERVEYPHGTYLPWMFYKKNGVGTVKISRDVTWGNTDTFPGFTFDVEHGDTIATFVIPLACGNIALLSERPKPVAVAPPPNQAPTCAMTVTPQKAFCGEPITIDAGGSADPDGSITSMSITVVDPEGTILTREEIATGALVAQIPMPCGDNTLRVSVIDDDGAESSSAQCVAGVQGVDRVRVLADVGFYRQFDPGTYLFGRVGAEYRINEDFSVLGMVGVAPQIDGEDGETAILVDVLGEYSFASIYFVNFGLGGWLTDGDSDLETEDSQLDVILGLGARIYGEPEAFNTSLFVEIRSAVDELDGLKEYGRFGAGLRFRF
ncbi:hypothetical protein [Desulfofustis glycolicus]|uniref:Outer membrane protein beta-barrel domain-containing protein n=1 Tax=Desulfofustis glycolicus DSM 9705 TaxID=1121409 RepID=A0A1M5TH67_9BACT|nr:hypothetical protein [Desulfofustis glycolicus]MCB2216404.1 hypothetical protein [Desulfobulbaceae bacterium]SHH50001.1 hypothetical protein SAMN02745124_00715 [Desulfofustis glycolicus DSM 9705]